MGVEAKPAKLTGKQRAFVDAYFAYHFNASRAALEAGYSARSAHSIGAENLKKPEIADEIRRRMAERVMSADEVLARLSNIARGSFDDVLVIERVPDDAGTERIEVRVDWEKAQDTGAIHLFKKLKWGQFGPEIELHDPVVALQLIGKQHGLFKENDLLKYIDLTKLSDEQVDRLANGDDPLSVLLNK